MITITTIITLLLHMSTTYGVVPFARWKCCRAMTVLNCATQPAFSLLLVVLQVVLV